MLVHLSSVCDVGTGGENLGGVRSCLVKLGHVRSGYEIYVRLNHVKSAFVRLGQL